MSNFRDLSEFRGKAEWMDPDVQYVFPRSLGNDDGKCSVLYK